MVCFWFFFYGCISCMHVDFVELVCCYMYVDENSGNGIENWLLFLFHVSFIEDYWYWYCLFANFIVWWGHYFSKNHDTEKSCNDSENTFVLSFGVSKYHDLEFYGIQVLETLFGYEGILKNTYWWKYVFWFSKYFYGFSIGENMFFDFQNTFMGFLLVKMKVIIFCVTEYLSHWLVFLIWK